jgi:hypothetical protein
MAAGPKNHPRLAVRLGKASSEPTMELVNEWFRAVDSGYVAPHLRLVLDEMPPQSRSAPRNFEAL